MQGIKHLIECHCTLPQYRKREEVVYHKFVVFSIIDDSDTVLEKIAQCNNCGVLHRVFDICKSDVMVGNEESKASVLSKEDMKFMLPSAVSDVLTSYDADLATWELCLFVVENRQFDTSIVLSREEDQESGTVKGKIMRITENGTVKLETFVTDIYVGGDR